MAWEGWHVPEKRCTLWEGKQGKQTWAPQAPREGPEVDHGYGRATQQWAGARLCQLGDLYLSLVFSQGCFFFFFFLNSEVPLSISATGWLVLALTSLLMHPPIQALFPLGSDPGSGALCCGSQQPHSSRQACLGLWTLSLFPACSVTRSWQQPCDADRRAISSLETGTLSPELIDLRVGHPPAL